MQLLLPNQWKTGIIFSSQFNSFSLQRVVDNWEFHVETMQTGFHAFPIFLLTLQNYLRRLGLWLHHRRGFHPSKGCFLRRLTRTALVMLCSQQAARAQCCCLHRGLLHADVYDICIHYSHIHKLKWRNMADKKGDAPPEDNISCCETPARTGSLSAGDNIPLLACEVTQERIPRSHMQHFCRIPIAVCFYWNLPIFLRAKVSSCRWALGFHKLRKQPSNITSDDVNSSMVKNGEESCFSGYYPLSTGSHDSSLSTTWACMLPWMWIDARNITGITNVSIFFATFGSQISSAQFQEDFCTANSPDAASLRTALWQLPGVSSLSYFPVKKRWIKAGLLLLPLCNAVWDLVFLQNKIQGRSKLLFSWKGFWPTQRQQKGKGTRCATWHVPKTAQFPTGRGISPLWKGNSVKIFATPQLHGKE